VQKYPHVDTFYDQGRVKVITSVQRRRRWSWVEKERIVAAALEPGAVASEVARAAGIHIRRGGRHPRRLGLRGILFQIRELKLKPVPTARHAPRTGRTARVADCVSRT
jgi:transposase